MVSILALELAAEIKPRLPSGCWYVYWKKCSFNKHLAVLHTRMPNLFTAISLEETTYNIQQVSRGSFKQAQFGHLPLLWVPGVEYGGREKLLDSGLRCETFYSQGKPCEGKLRRRIRGNEGVLAVHDGDQEVGIEQPAAASEEFEAEDRELQLSANVSAGQERIFIFGFGYTSCALAKYLKNIWKVSGTCRSEEKKEALRDSGYSAHVFNSDNDGEELSDEGLRELQQATHWLISVPPVADFDNDPVLTRHVQDLKQTVANGSVRWIGYLSSTGVYGDWQGNWVDEESDPRPVEQRALARLAAEKSWLKFGLNHGVPVHVFRLGGIYGPGRSAINTVLQTQDLSRRQQNRAQRRFTSRIHVDDICQTLLASMQNPVSGKIYNVVDDDPASRMEVLSYAEDLLKNRDTHSRKVSTKNLVASSNRLGEKRVSNKRMKLDLKVKLLYPTYREGLEAILKTINYGKE